jgi:MFS family permease
VRTLWLCGGLHAFTHVYHVALAPLFLLIQQDLKLASIGKSTLLVTIMMAAYFVPSYPMGILADRFSRKKLLGYGLAINGLGFFGLSFAPNYGTAVACVIVAGFGGSFFHPAATAMVVRLFPVNTGKALGLVAIGASVGFFLGPVYMGWRAEFAGWRVPVRELGLLGVLGAILFAWLGEEESSQRLAATKTPRSVEKLFPTAALWLLFIAASFAFSLRDFTGNSMGTLGSLFLQKAHHVDLKATGLAVSAIFLLSAVSNPIFGGLSDRGRIRWVSLVLVIAAGLVAAVPHLPRPWLIPTFMLYGFFFMSSYPMLEAELMQAVPDPVRGRVFGLFITVGGLVGNLSHWLVGRWVNHMGEAANSPAGYYSLYGALACLVILSLLGLPCLHAIGRRERMGISPPVPAPFPSRNAPEHALE